MGAKQCNKFSLLPEEDVLPLFEYLLCGRGQLCEKLHGMMHTYIQDHRRVSKSFLLPWMLDCQDRPSHFHLIKILILHNLKKFIADMFVIKEGIPSWSIPDTSNHSSVGQQREGKENFILIQWILTYHKVNMQCTCMNACVCLYLCVYVNSTCWWCSLQIIFPSLYFAAIFFRGQLFNILYYGVCCSYSCIRSRTQKYVNWEQIWTFLKSEK